MESGVGLLQPLQDEPTLGIVLVISAHKDTAIVRSFPYKNWRFLKPLCPGTLIRVDGFHKMFNAATCQYRCKSPGNGRRLLMVGIADVKPVFHSPIPGRIELANQLLQTHCACYAHIEYRVESNRPLANMLKESLRLVGITFEIELYLPRVDEVVMVTIAIGALLRRFR